MRFIGLHPPSESEYCARVGKKKFFLDSIVEPQLFEAKQRLLHVYIWKISAEKRLVLEPSSNGSLKNLRQLLRQVARRVHVDILLVSQNRKELFLPGPAG